MENKPYDRLDAILDAGLDTYAEVEALAGLEERILNRVKVAQSGIHSRRLPLLAIGVASLALFCLCVTLVDQKRIEQETAPRKAEQAPAVARLESRVPASLPVEQRRSLPIKHRLRQLPKQEQFPTPEPPSAEERAMLRFIERDPKEAAEAFASLRREGNEPVAIEPLEIKPLQTDGVNN